MGNVKPKIIAISGSTRHNSTNENILKIIAELYKNSLDITLYNGIAELPHFNPDIADDQIASSVKDFRELIAAADGVLICTPEYVFSLPGSLKNALEWTVSTTVFSDKPVACIVASGLGEKALESLVLIMKTLVGTEINPETTLLISGARSKVKPDGTFSDDTTSVKIKELMEAFISMLPQTNRSNGMV